MHPFWYPWWGRRRPAASRFFSRISFSIPYCWTIWKCNSWSRLGIDRSWWWSREINHRSTSSEASPLVYNVQELSVEVHLRWVNACKLTEPLFWAELHLRYNPQLWGEFDRIKSLLVETPAHKTVTSWTLDRTRAPERVRLLCNLKLLAANLLSLFQIHSYIYVCIFSLAPLSNFVRIIWEKCSLAWRTHVLPHFFSSREFSEVDRQTLS